MTTNQIEPKTNQVEPKTDQVEPKTNQVEPKQGGLAIKPSGHTLDNVVVAQVPALFDDTNLEEKLKEMHLAALAKGNEAIRWYAERKKRKRRAATWFRVLAIAFATATTALPLASAFFADTHQRRLVAAASICGVLAAALIATDKFFGFSSGWMRYVAAMQDLNRRVELYSIEWNKRVLSGQLAPTDKASVAAALESTSTFLSGVADVVHSETQSWATEFRGNLAEFEVKVAQERAALPAPVRTGALKVEVSGFEQLQDKSFTLELNDRPGVVVQGGVGVFTDLAPGTYRVRVTAASKGIAVQATDIAVIKPGEVAALVLVPK